MPSEPPSEEPLVPTPVETEGVVATRRGNGSDYNNTCVACGKWIGIGLACNACDSEE
jgi:hypothetical protein